MGYIKKSYYEYDNAFRFALNESHEELSNIVKNKLWYIKNKADILSLLDVCFKEERIPLKSIEMILEASSYKAKTLLQKLHDPFWSCIIHQQTEKFEFLLKQGIYTYQNSYKSLTQALIEFNHLELFEIACQYHKKLPIKKEELKSLFISQFEQSHVKDYALIIIQHYPLKQIKEILKLAQDIDFSNNHSSEKILLKQHDFVVFMEKFVIEKKHNCDIMPSNTLEPKKKA